MFVENITISIRRLEMRDRSFRRQNIKKDKARLQKSQLPTFIGKKLRIKGHPYWELEGLSSENVFSLLNDKEA